MITIKINTNNAAFNNENGVSNDYIRNLETARILKKLAEKLEKLPDVTWNAVPLYDINGNHIGSFIYNPLD